MLNLSPFCFDLLACADFQPELNYGFLEEVLKLPEGYFSGYVLGEGEGGANSSILDSIKAVPGWIRGKILGGE